MTEEDLSPVAKSWLTQARRVVESCEGPRRTVLDRILCTAIRDPVEPLFAQVCEQGFPTKEDAAKALFELVKKCRDAASEVVTRPNPFDFIGKGHAEPNLWQQYMDWLEYRLDQIEAAIGEIPWERSSSSSPSS